MVKALPWFTDVRVKINDPAYAGWFLHLDDNTSAPFYHDTQQTVPGDCGGVVCGEYLWDHRNARWVLYAMPGFLLAHRWGWAR